MKPSLSKTTSLISILIITLLLTHCRQTDPIKSSPPAIHDTLWVAPDTNAIPATAEGSLIRYGRSLISNTAFYFGPHGKITASSNGMNCQNCHLDAGTKPWGNNFGAVYSTYPKFRERRHAIEGVFQRINDCFLRSLNGKEIDPSSHEMLAMLAYIKWLGTKVAKGVKPAGTGLAQLPFLNRAANPANGKSVYQTKCVSCHGLDGQGKLNPDATSYQYPPLWGNHSYNTSAGLYRLSSFAAFIKNNMPFGSTYKNPQLSDEEAWDLASFINSQPRPAVNFRQDWPDKSVKPVDYPFGPYIDSFSEQQHKYGPFSPIKKWKEQAFAKKTAR